MQHTTNPQRRFRRTPLLVLTALCLALFEPRIASAIVAGQIDDFQDGTTQFWHKGQPNNVAN